MTSILEIQAIQKKGEPRLLLEAWQRFEKEEIGDDRNLTVQELAEKFLARQKAQGRSPRTLIDDRSRLNAMTMTQLTSVQLIEAALWRELGSTEPQSFSDLVLLM